MFVSFAPLNTKAAASNAKPKAQKKSRSKVAPEFKGAAAGGTVRVIVQTKGRPTAAHDEAIKAGRGAKRQAFDSLDVVVADLPASEVASLAAREDVLYVSPDRPVKAQMDVTSETTGAALASLDGTAESPGFTGKGVTIAVIDSGVSASRPDFRGQNNKSRVLAAVDFTGAGSSTQADGIMLGDGILLAD